MFIIFFILLGIILGYICGGKLSNLLNYPFHGIIFVFLSLAIQLAIFSDIPLFKNMNANVVASLHIASYILLIVFIILNKKNYGIIAIGTGMLLNLLVISVNGGHMPVSIVKLENTSMARHALDITNNASFNNATNLSGHTRLAFLGDIFKLPSFLPLSNVFSIGDILIALGILIYFIKCMKAPKADK